MLDILCNFRLTEGTLLNTKMLSNEGRYLTSNSRFYNTMNSCDYPLTHSYTACTDLNLILKNIGTMKNRNINIDYLRKGKIYLNRNHESLRS